MLKYLSIRLNYTCVVKASGDLESLQTEYNSLKDAKISNQKEFAKDPSNAKRMEVLEKQNP